VFRTRVRRTKITSNFPQDPTPKQASGLVGPQNRMPVSKENFLFLNDVFAIIMMLPGQELGFFTSYDSYGGSCISVDSLPQCEASCFEFELGLT